MLILFVTKNKIKKKVLNETLSISL